MSQKIAIDKLADEVNKSLEEYAKVTNDGVKEAVKTVAKDVRDQIEKTAPKDTGKYAKSWSVKATKESSNAYEMTVYSKKHYRLTHLLENGHALRQGGRTKAMPHIEPAEQMGIKELEEEIKKRVGG